MLEDNTFPGGSEMAQRMRQCDWTKSELGHPATWPQSLRTVVRVVLHSRYPMFVWWGPHFAQLYNDAYIPILGSRHPEALGRLGRDVWSDIWDVIGPQANDVLCKGESTWNERLLLVMQRHGYKEESYFTFSYSPVYDDDGSIGGVFCAVAEETERVLSERRMAALAALASKTAGAESEQQACERAVAALEPFAHDLPFVQVYVQRPSTEAELVAATVVPSGERPGPRGDGEWSNANWPFAESAQSGWTVVDDLPGRGLVVGAGPWPEPVTRAVMVPLDGTERSGESLHLVVGTSTRRPLDVEYRRFIELVANQLGKAITDARQVEHERRRAAELAELDRAKTVFFSNVSHELRTPLTLILGPLEEAQRTPDLDATTREQLLTAQSNAQRLLRLVNTLLDFARIESGRIHARFAPTDLAGLTAHLASNFRSACERAGLILEVNCPPLAEPVYVDRELWEKVVLNLLSNAFKFTREGYIRVFVRESAGSSARLRAAEVVIEDSGVGIAAADLPRLFRRFERIEGTWGRSFEGSGIGLSLVSELVHVHGGSVTVESELGRGSRFVVTLPFGRDHLPAEAVVQETAGLESSGFMPMASPDLYVAEVMQWLRGDNATETPRPVDVAVRAEPVPEIAWASGDKTREASGSVEQVSHHVLVADDNADMRRYVCRVLGGGHRITLAKDGEEAWRWIVNDPPDLVITDIMMPRLDGFGLISRIRNDRRTRETPIIALSARAGEESRVEGLQSGADVYLAKPFTANELVAHVNAQFRLAHAARDRARLLASAQSARAESEYQRRQLRSVFDQAPTLIAVFRGPNHVVELANYRICQAWGRQQDEVLGKPFFDAVPEGREQSWRPLLDGVFQRGEPYIGRETEAKFERDGRLETSFYDFVWAPLREEGTVDGVIVVATDVTDQVLARRELSGLREAAESANRAKDEFLAMLGHELRNPLAPITTALELLKLKGIEAGERERAIIERQVSHLVTLVDDLLDVSRITRGKVELKRTFVELSDVVSKAIEMASPLLEQQLHELRVEVPAMGLGLLADPGRLAQVVSNVLTNAAKYTERGGLVHISAELENGDVVLRVADTGVGIAPDMLPHIFDLFAQESQTLARSRGGLGLGLTIARSLVSLHGGTISAESAGSGCGATFTIRLPSALHSPARDGVSPDSASRRENAVAVGLRVLVVDDNEDAAEMLAELLQHLGCKVQTVNDGPTALDLVSEFRPDVALLDIGLPVMDGYELARRLAQSPGLEGIRLVAVTGYGQSKDRERSAAAGFHVHLVKPLGLSQLRETLKLLSPQGNDQAPVSTRSRVSLGQG